MSDQPPALVPTPTEKKRRSLGFRIFRAYAIFVAVIAVLGGIGGVFFEVVGSSASALAAASSSLSTSSPASTSSTTSTTLDPGLLPQSAADKTSNLWAQFTGEWLGLTNDEAERVGLWAEGLATYIVDGDGHCDEVIRQVTRWGDMAGVSNGEMAAMLDAWSGPNNSYGIDFESAWNSCI